MQTNRHIVELLLQDAAAALGFRHLLLHVTLVCVFSHCQNEHAAFTLLLQLHTEIHPAQNIAQVSNMQVCMCMRARSHACVRESIRTPSTHSHLDEGSSEQDRRALYGLALDLILGRLLLVHSLACVHVHVRVS